MKFTKKYKVLYYDIDVNGAIYPSRLLTYLQETANEHTFVLGCDPDAMTEKYSGGFWLTRFCMSIPRAIRFGDEIEVTTWPTNDSRGFSFNRCFEVKVGGEVVCEAYSVWALMNRETMMPVKVKDFDIALDEDEPIKPAAPLHARLPKEIELVSGGEYKVGYAAIDYNGHMNNARYPDIVCGFLPPKVLSGKRVEELTISYLHEAPAGDSIKGFYAADPEEQDVYYVRTERASDSATNVEVRIKLTEV